jgi:CBS domain containing-hemolysin-like protein
MDAFLFIRQMVIILLLVLANGFFVAAEFAIVKVRASQLKPMLQSGDWRVRFASRVTTQVDAYLSACQLGITFTSLGLGWLGEPFVARWLQVPLKGWLGITSETLIHSISYVVAFGAITFLHIAAGEQAPKMLAIRRPRRVSLWVSPLLVGFYYTFMPVIWVLNCTANAMLRAVGIEPTTEMEHTFSPEELQHILMHSRHVHPADELINRLMLKALRLKETTAEEIMLPKDKVCVLWLNAPLEDSLRYAEKVGYSRLPVCGDSLEDVVGIVHVKELLWQYRGLGDQTSLRDIMRPVLTFTPQTRLPAMLQLFQKSRSHLAVVVDADNKMLGIVSFEDVLEELVGDIRDEFDIEKGPVYARTEDSILVDADLPMRDLEFETGWGFPTHTTDTVEKWCLKQWGRQPATGEELRVGNITIMAEEVSPRGLRRVRLVHQPRDGGQSKR